MENILKKLINKFKRLIILKKDELMIKFNRSIRCITFICGDI